MPRLAQSHFVSLAFLALVVTGGCSSEVVAPDPVPAGGAGGGGVTGGTAGTGGQLPPPSPTMQVSAPDETTVEVRFNVPPAAPSFSAVQTYLIGSDRGSLEVTGVEIDTIARTALLTTAKQKLGVTYQLELSVPGEPADGLEKGFLAADTASFWASDFSSPNYDDYVVVADRVAVGEHCVIYVEQGETAMGAQQAADDFDEEIYPVETALFIEAPDFDGNGRIVLLGLDGGPYYGGYFSATNAYPDEDIYKQWGLHSNEMEMLYINVAGIGAIDMTHVTPHELQHLLYHERHGLQYDYFAYHDEGLAEAAVLAVHGANHYAPSHYVDDPSGAIGSGISLVNWGVGDYDQYARAYLLWAYVASRLGGVDALGEIFDQDGHPVQIGSFLTSELGTDLMSTYRDMLIATWVQASSGPLGFEQLVTLPGRPPTVPVGTSSLELEPYGGAFFPLDVAQIDYPGTQGTNIQYIGINAAGVVDDVAPFDVAGGALLALNTKPHVNSFPTEHSGPDVPATSPGSGAQEPGPEPQQALMPNLTWLDPPPVHPAYREHLDKWRRARELGRAR